MAIPPGAAIWLQPFDPSDKLDYVAQFGDLLAESETIVSFTATALAEAALLGLTILDDDAHGPWIANDTNIELWFEVAVEERANIAFSGAGASLGVEITITTDAVPPRRFQRTFVLKALQL